MRSRAAAAAAGADVTLVAGPVALPDPAGREVDQDRDRAGDAGRRASGRCRPMSRYSPPRSPTGASPKRARRRSRRAAAGAPQLSLVENPDILATIAHRKTERPRLVIGFAAETENVIANAKAKRERKGCDWIVANDVSPATGIMGGDRNTVHLVTARRRRVLAGRRRRTTWRRTLVARIAAALRRRPMTARRSPGHAPAARRRTCRCPITKARTPPGSISSPPCRADAPVTLAPGSARLIPTGLCDRAAGRLRGPGPAPLRARRATRRHRAQRARHDRCGLPRRGAGHPDQSRQRAVRRHPRHAHCAVGHRAGGTRGFARSPRSKTPRGAPAASARPAGDGRVRRRDPSRRPGERGGIGGRRQGSQRLREWGGPKANCPDVTVARQWRFSGFCHDLAKAYCYIWQLGEPLRGKGAQLFLARQFAAAVTALLLIAGAFFVFLFSAADVTGRRSIRHAAKTRPSSRSCPRRSRRGRARLCASSSPRRSRSRASFR